MILYSIQIAKMIEKKHSYYVYDMYIHIYFIDKKIGE